MRTQVVRGADGPTGAMVDRMQDRCEQPALRGVERRRDRRHPAASAFWIRHRGTGRTHSAWMVNWSAGGAACLVSDAARLQVGDAVELTAIYSADQAVVENAPAVPRGARILRIDDSPEALRRVALRFETEVDAPLDVCEPQRVTVQALRPASLPVETVGTPLTLPRVEVYPRRLEHPSA